MVASCECFWIVFPTTVRPKRLLFDFDIGGMNRETERRNTLSRSILRGINLGISTSGSLQSQRLGFLVPFLWVVGTFTLEICLLCTLCENLPDEQSDQRDFLQARKYFVAHLHLFHPDWTIVQDLYQDKRNGKYPRLGLSTYIKVCG